MPPAHTCEGGYLHCPTCAPKKPAEKIRVGDMVKIVVPSFVERVGYPKTPADYLPLVEAVMPELNLAFRKLLNPAPTLSLGLGYMPTGKNTTVQRIKRDLAYLAAKHDGFGGPERSLHLREVESAKDTEVEVLQLKTVVTGQYEPGSGGSTYSNYQGDYDDPEPAYLANPKRHRLALVSWWSAVAFAEIGTMQHAKVGLEHGPWIEIGNLARIGEKPPYRGPHRETP